MATTLGINLGTGTILIAPDRGQDDPPQEWTADKMTHYSREGKHVFMELVRPSKSIDFHAGAKDTAEEIVAALGELAGAARAEGLKEVIMAGSQKRHKKGTVLYDFMAQGEDEVTVAAGDDVIIIDDSRSEEWWQVRRLKNGKEGVVPSSYIELTGTITPPPTQIPPASASLGHNSARSTVEQNRQEEIRLTKEAMKASKETQQVGLGMRLPERGSSLTAKENGNNLGQQRNQRDNGRNDRGGQTKPKAKPDSAKVRTWSDRSKSFSVEAQFLGLKDGKLHLHKMNGVKIAVPIAKMSREDLEYVEDLTGISLDDERPLADVKKSKSSEPKPPGAGASIDKTQNRPEYDWFQFFLSCDVAVGLCERYAQAFTKDSMDESVLPDVDASILRNLGLREGDIIKVMRTLDAKFSRERGNKAGGEGDSSSGGLFSGPRGTLRNNTRKGRPAPAVQTSDVVDAAAFSTKETASSSNDGVKSPLSTSPTKSPEAPTAGFDDDAWDLKPSKKEQQQATRETKPAAPTEQVPNPAPVTPALTGSMQELSLLTTPLQPSHVEPSIQAKPQSASANGGNVETPAPAPSQQLPGASPSFFSSVSQISPKSLARQRPVPPSMSPPVQGSLVPPPPQRPLSAPQAVVQQGMFPPPALTPQLTGIVQGQVAPLGQSLHDLSQARLQQQYAAQLQQMQPVLTGYPGTQSQGLAAFPTGAPAQFMQPMLTGAPGMSPFANPGGSNQFASIQPQHTGFHPGFAQPGFAQPAPGHINSYLPPPLEPQRTGLSTLQSQQTGIAGAFSPGIQAQPLVPQKTGPPPPVRFGVTGEAKKLTPQPTGRRANLAQATPQNPFGF
ncbi:Actin cytoskeleton-regulatory complex protein sla1 [Cladobotryum mycophilum]|uniref:Actin cytoskeleton-regulatory complex protein SLA1 n=1 Tax=Cladobotryum mycophilum TaxID=491253 RepID=A0ABR0S6E5_9HYPO